MVRSRIAPWLGAVVCGALIYTPAYAGGFWKVFSHRSDGCDRPAAQTCQNQCQCPQCQNCPPKKKKTCCLCPPEPPTAPVGTSVAADAQAQFPDNSQQDDRLDKLDKDLSRLSAIVEKMLMDQQGTGTTMRSVPRNLPQQTQVDSVPPGPSPATTRISNRLPSVQQVSVPNANTAAGR